MIFNLIGISLMIIAFGISLHAVSSYHIVYDAPIISERVFISMIIGLIALVFIPDRRYCEKFVRSLEGNENK